MRTLPVSNVGEHASQQQQGSGVRRVELARGFISGDGPIGESKPNGRCASRQIQTRSARGVRPREATGRPNQVNTGAFDIFAVSANDVQEGKPQPEIFVKALEWLNRSVGAAAPIAPSECLVIEDSREGVAGARRAAMRCLAVTNSHPAEELRSADAVVSSLANVTIPFLESLLK